MPVILRLTEWDMDWVVNVANWVGINRRQLFGDSGSLPPMKEETRQYLQELYEGEIGELESLSEKDLDCWREQSRK